MRTRMPATCLGFGGMSKMQALPRVWAGGISPPWGIIEANDWGMDARASYG